MGHTSVSGLTEARALYVAGYVLKKMTHRLDARLDGRAPEFARMSNRPGIGAPAMLAVALALSLNGRTFVDPGLNHGKKVSPLGRYLRTQVAKWITDGSKEQISKALQSDKWQQERAEVMRLVREYSWANEQTTLETIQQITSQSKPWQERGTL